MLEVPDFPTNPSAGSHKVPFNHIVYIDSSDFKEAGDKGEWARVWVMRSVILYWYTVSEGSSKDIYLEF